MNIKSVSSISRVTHREDDETPVTKPPRALKELSVPTNTASSPSLAPERKPFSQSHRRAGGTFRFRLQSHRRKEDGDSSTGLKALFLIKYPWRKATLMKVKIYFFSYKGPYECLHMVSCPAILVLLGNTTEPAHFISDSRKTFRLTCQCYPEGTLVIKGRGRLLPEVRQLGRESRSTRAPQVC